MTWTTEALLALAARTKVWALAMLAWLADAVGGRFRETVRADVRRAEDGVAAILVLLALKRLPPPPPLPPGRGRRPPHAAPQGFARRAVKGSDMRNMRRFLMPRSRSLAARIRRLLALLDARTAHFPDLDRRIERVPPAFVLIAVAPPATPVNPQACADAARADTS